MRAAARVTFKPGMCSERKQTQKIVSCTILFIQNVQKKQMYKDGRLLADWDQLGMEMNCKWVREICSGWWKYSKTGLQRWWNDLMNTPNISELDP